MEYDIKGNKIAEFDYNAEKVLNSKVEYDYNKKNQMTEKRQYRDCEAGNCIRYATNKYTYDASGNILTDEVYQASEIATHLLKYKYEYFTKE